MRFLTALMLSGTTSKEEYPEQQTLVRMTELDLAQCTRSSIARAQEPLYVHEHLISGHYSTNYHP